MIDLILGNSRAWVHIQKPIRRERLPEFRPGARDRLDHMHPQCARAALEASWMHDSPAWHVSPNTWPSDVR